MHNEQNGCLTDADLHAFFDRLFPHGFAGADVLAEVAPNGWEQSPLPACFHPSVEHVFEARLQLHREIASLGRLLNRRNDDVTADRQPTSGPTLDDVQREYKTTPVRPDEELT